MEDVRYDIETRAELKRDIRLFTINYQGHSKTFDMPGWYPSSEECEATFTQNDLKVLTYYGTLKLRGSPKPHAGVLNLCSGHFG
ncbi:MAG: hypothetical protein J6N51_14435 [Selenomonas sp.]|nr:hypothetical protein [Selenomonas sp.]